jgi:hypothetical protein
MAPKFVYSEQKVLDGMGYKTFEDPIAGGEEKIRQERIKRQQEGYQFSLFRQVFSLSITRAWYLTCVFL